LADQLTVLDQMDEDIARIKSLTRIALAIPVV
jgi:hypothetical protein